MNERTVSLGTHDIFVRDCGDGPPLVFAHSLSFDGTMWSAQIDALKNRYHVYTLDLRAHGRSSAPAEGPYKLDDVAEDIESVCVELGLESVGFCGVSLGGMAGMRLALRHPERIKALALLNTSAEREDPSARQMYEDFNERGRGKPANPVAVDFFIALMFSERFRAEHADVVTGFRDIAARDVTDGIYWMTKAFLGRSSLLKRLRHIAVPTIVISSGGDLAIPLAYTKSIADAIDGAWFHDMGTAGHMTPVECADDVNQLLSHFLDEAMLS
jgi:pimeloyl-ACP methyl ester carboxylesterase